MRYIIVRMRPIVSLCSHGDLSRSLRSGKLLDEVCICGGPVGPVGFLGRGHRPEGAHVRALRLMHRNEDRVEPEPVQPRRSRSDPPSQTPWPIKVLPSIQRQATASNRALRDRPSDNNRRIPSHPIVSSAWALSTRREIAQGGNEQTCILDEHPSGPIEHGHGLVDLVMRHVLE